MSARSDLRKPGGVIPVDTSIETRARTEGSRASRGYNIDQKMFIANNYYQSCIVRRDMQTRARDEIGPGLQGDIAQGFGFFMCLAALACLIPVDAAIFFVGVGVSLLYILTTT
ncbi:MAG TPA: hypothetical protein VK624_10010 [Steroidobacteraceae bacterium]|nr:hypothetical protein [Steroidobacteraceae bacterium]